MLNILSSLPVVKEITYLGHKGQIALISKEYQQPENSGVSFKSVNVYEQLGGKHWFKKIGYEILGVQRLLQQAPEGSLLFLCSLSPISSFFYKLIKIFYRKQKVFITLHGDIDFIQQNKSRLRNFLGRFFIWSFKIKDANTKYIVLSRQIRDNLIGTGYLDAGEMYAINHPYLFEKEAVTKTLTKPLRVGHIGLASLEKRAQLIFSLAENLRKEVLSGEIEFSIIGTATQMDDYQNDLVLYNPHSGMLSKAEFNAKIAALDYIVFYYSDDNYRFCSSGAILDAINHQIPIVSLRNQGFQAIFKEARGPIGYLCDDLEEMTVLFREMILEGQGHSAQEFYQKMSQNLGCLKNAYTLEAVKTNLLEQAKQFIYGK